MKLLNLNSGDEAATPNKKRSKWLKIGIGLSALVLIPTIGSTLAGSININAGSAVEFGQGVVSTAACDGAITVAPTSQLTIPTNPSTLPYFSLGGFRVSDIDGSSCDPVTFIIRAYDSNGAPTPLCTYQTELKVFYNPTGFNLNDGIHYGAPSCGSFGSYNITTSTDGYFEWNPDFSVNSSEVNTITIESSSLPCNFGICD
jgi:hypothetical protein